MSAVVNPKEWSRESSPIYAGIIILFIALRLQ
uniref:Uncharacterized protein n=1 Tax=Rhizophora mucronata TaxID=61149 RepID=A0A2P2Q932_RHIMU